MDCNSYSYAPYMLDEGEGIIDRYENDDMHAELEQCGKNWFTVYAYSYDGSFEVAEWFYTEERAKRLYEHIVNNYSGSRPMDGEIEQFIENLRREIA